MSVVMVYRLVPGRSAGSDLRMAMAGMSGSGLAANPAVALLLVIFMVGYILWTADQLAARSRGRTQPVAAGTAAQGVTAKRVSSLHLKLAARLR